MSRVILPTDLNDILANLSQRIDNLETGGKPITKRTPVASGSTTLASGAQVVFTASVSWADANEDSIMHAIPFLTVYVDTDDSVDDEYGGGGNVDETQHEVFWYLSEEDSSNTSSVLVVFIQNNDSSSHTYYLDVDWRYIAGSSSSS